MLRRSFSSSAINTASAVCLVLVLSGACARATYDEPGPVAQGGQFTGTPTGGATSPTGGTLGTTGGVGTPSGGAAPSTGGVTASGGNAGGAPGTGGKSTTGGQPNPFGGDPTGGKATATGGASSGGTTSSGGRASSAGSGGGGASATGGRAGGSGGSGGTGGTSRATGGTAGVTGSSADCDFDAAECAELSCAEACPTDMGTYCATACQAIIDCIDDNPMCGTAVDPMCVRRNGGMPAKCTSVWESGSGTSTPVGAPAKTAITFFNCACGGVLPEDTGSEPSGGSGGSASPGAGGAP